MDVNQADLIAISRKIAYEGNLGRKRREFCESFVRYKKERFKQINLGQIEKAQTTGQTITCRGGCQYASCCYEYVDASLGEIEAIVYFLYHNENILKRFIKQYRKWEPQINSHPTLMTSLESQSWNQTENAGGLQGLYRQYYDQHAFCPFLNTDNKSCLIYDVRPFTCAAYVVTSPLSCCAPDYEGVVPVERHLPAEGDYDKTKFYFSQIEKLMFVGMPNAVFELLTKSYFYLSSFPGLEGIELKAINDKSVRNKLNPSRANP